MQHLDEGTIHAWLDGQLPRDEALEVEAHVARCRQCADAVAEARGLIAASSRILMALDNVPRDVVPASAPPRAEPSVQRSDAHQPEPIRGSARRPRRRWFNGMTLAAAATIVIAIGTTLMLPSYKQPRSLGDRSTAPVAAARSMDSATVSAPAPVVATMPAAPPTPAPALGATGQPAEQRFAGVAPANELRREADRPAPRPAPPSVDESRSDVARVAETAGTGTVKVMSGRVVEPVDATARQKAADLKDAKGRLQGVAAPPVVFGTPAQSSEIAIRGASSVRADSSANVLVQRAPGATAAVGVGSVRGRVTDANNTGLSGAMVTIMGTNAGVVTNAAGEYTVGGLTSGAHRLLVRRIGYDTTSREVAIAAGQTSTADIVLRPMPTALSEVVTTGTAASRSVPAARKAAAPSDRAAAIETPPGAPITATQSNAIGCYELGITSATPTRDGFRQVPRRVALDADIVPANADGVWYRARDLARTGAAPDGLWRPAGPDAIEIEWTYGSRTARVRMAGPAGSMMRGTLEEIDRAAATGEAGTVVAVRRSCTP